jgi:hypothetical protein
MRRLSARGARGALALLLAAGAPIAAYAQTATLPSTGTAAVTTYEAAGLYWQSPGGTAGCEVKYRKYGTTAWRQGLAMWYDARDGQCRGSIVGLETGTWYQAELNLPGQAATRGLVFQTWSNTRPVAQTIAVNAGSATYNVAQGGSASGYVVYEGSGATLDAANNAQYNVTINASYVIVRGLNLRGAKQDAIRISPTAHDVVIEDNDISGWGRTRDGKWGADMDSAIRAVCTDTATPLRWTIQRNRMHDPRYGANSWSDGHPAGPQGITLSYCGGNNVIRHNEIYSNNGNYFNDTMGGEDNFSKAGFPNADSDIYGNRLANAWDDGIESEGANENVRIWGNYLDKTATGIATTVTSVGPIYIFRNVYNRSQFYQTISSLDADDRQVFFKSGSDSSLGDGRRYLLHNTMLQAVQSGLQYPLGAGAGVGGTGSTQLINNTWSKNNIYQLWKPKGAMYQVGSGNDFANDLYSGTPGEAGYTSGLQGTPVYAAGNGWQSEAGGMYQLATSSPGYGRGVKIPNFNDDAASPDVGAHQSGSAAMKFGVAASSGSSVGGGGGATNSPANLVDRYRLYSPVTLEHHFTTSLNEYSTLGTYAGTWAQEGSIGKMLDGPGSYNGVTAVPYYRLYNPGLRQHLWTADANEYGVLSRTPGWSGEGVDGYILPSATTGTIPLYRLSYPDGRGLHLWTTDANEYSVLTGSRGWIGEGIAGFMVR